MSDLFDNSPIEDHNTQGPYARVALEQGIDAAPTGLTYRIPPDLAQLQVGDRVLVPLGRGNRKVHGYIITLSDETEFDARRVKPILAADAAGVSLPVDLIDLARWISSYYCCPLGMVFSTMLPAAVKRRTGIAQRTFVRRTQPTPQIKLTPLQQTVLDTANDQWIEMKALADTAGAKTLSPVKQLLEKNALESKRAEIIVSDLDILTSKEKLPGQRFALMPAQQTALTALQKSLGQFGVHLLHGVTGSGKTEVYLRLIDTLLTSPPGSFPPRDPSSPSPPKSPPGVIVLVPEIALTPQTVARFTHRFEGVAVLHSGLTAAQRHRQWHRIRTDEAHIVIGARSAIFAPLDRLDLIIVDEEHESSYKQDQLPRYHARDVAIKRAQQLNIPVLLGSATPSLESYDNAARRHSYHLLSLPNRVAGMKLPQVEVVDMTAQRKKRRGIHLLSIPLEQQLRQTLARGGQAMLLLNRRGYANYIGCPDHRCGWMMTCQHCDATMVYHKIATLPTGGLVRCHHCGAEQLLAQQCPDSGHKISVFGLGTQKVEEELAKKFPEARQLRMDSDSMRKIGDYQQSLDAFREGEIDILLGTQMIAKGLDFPNVQLVGVISGDTALHLPDFRAAERTFQLISQVAGRAGRSDKPGRVIVQTFSPNDPVIALAAAHDYEGFARQELSIRKQIGLPPATRMMRIVVRDKDHTACRKRSLELAAQLSQCQQDSGSTIQVRGPVPCPIARIADFYRQEIVMIADNASDLQKRMTILRNSRLLISDAHTAIDVDPVAMM